LTVEIDMKNTIKSAFFAMFATLLTLPGVGTEALGETWPLRTVKLIVPLGPASGTDVTARLLADHLSKRWGKSVVVEHRPGADGIVGISAFLAGSPDDHTLLFAPTGTFAVQPFLHGKLTHNPDQLVPIARVTNTLIAVTVPTALNISSLGELMSSIRSQPGRYHWASVTGATDFVFSGFVERTGANMVRVPYRDSVLALNDLSEGRIEVFLSALATVLPQVGGGKIKVLALTNRERAPALPDVPTAAEAGFPTLQYDGLVGLFANSEMPIELRDRIARDVRAVIADPSVAMRIAATGQIVSPGTPTEFANSIAEQQASFAVIARTSEVQLKR
jgi:tripartite-type tricarboxylate transporter receptor subunit TctC